MNIFKYLFVLGRPASGKSEFIDFMKKLSDAERAEKYHIGKFEEIDDFPWIWEICTADDEREARGEKRLHSIRTPECYNLTTPKFRGSLVPRFNTAIAEKYSKRPDFFKDGTLLIEFARGKGDGFEESLSKFDPEILKNAAVLYIDVTFEESYRRNNSRYRADAKESILWHKVPDEDMYGYFIENDWAKITDAKRSGSINIAGHRLAFVSMDNSPESKDPVVLGPRYHAALNTLWNEMM